MQTYETCDFEPVKRSRVDQDVNYERNTFKNVLREIRKNKFALVCVSLLILIVIMSIFAFLSPYSPNKTDAVNSLQSPNAKHLLGTDDLGRDYFTRALYGGRVSLTVGFCSMLIAISFGTLIGTISGYCGGKVDIILMRFVDMFMSVPNLLLIIVINAFITPSLATIVLVIALFAWMGVARIVRAQTLTLKERDYVLAAKSMGAGGFTIIFKHIIPNMASEIIVAATISIARAILQESTLSFLGFGVQLPNASWGSMLKNAQQYILDMPYLALVPGILILLTVLSFNVLGDALRNALEPKMTK